jgi:hypothetical protein
MCFQSASPPPPPPPTPMPSNDDQAIRRQQIQQFAKEGAMMGGRIANTLTNGSGRLGDTGGPAQTRGSDSSLGSGGGAVTNSGGGSPSSSVLTG